MPQRFLEALRQPAALLDAEGNLVAVNKLGVAALGLDAPGTVFASAVLDASEHGGFQEVLGLAIEGHAWSGALHIPVLGAESVRVDVAPVRADDGATRVLVVMREPGVGSDAGRDLSDRISRLARVTAELVHAADVDIVTDIVIQHMADAAGATTASLSLRVDESTLALMGLRGGTPGAASRWATYAVDGSTPAGEAVRSGVTLVLVGRDQIVARFPDLTLAADGERSLLCVPLSVGDRRVGVVSLSFPYRKEFDPAELSFFQLLANTCAQAVERIRAEGEAEDRALKLRFLAQASAELGSSLDYESTLRRVAWLAVPQFADWASVSLEEGGLLRNIAVAHGDPEKLAIAEEYMRRYPPDPESGQGSYEVLHTGRSQLTREISDEQLVAATEDPEQLAMLRALGLRSGMVVPLRARGRTFGTLSLVSGESGRRFDEADVAFAEDLARRAATAIDNAQLHSELKDVAERLRQAVRPAPLPQGLPGWECAAIYLPAGGTGVGGDFYEVVPVDEERLVVVVGDVMGRGVTAASAMAHVRAGVRTLVAVDPSPPAVMAGLDRLFEQFPTDQLVTVAYALVDRARGSISLVCAGHPPPLLIRPDGEAAFAEEAKGLILGVVPRERPVVDLPFHKGDTLLLYTDGLIERRTEDLEVGKDRLLTRARSALACAPLDEGLRALVEQAPSLAADDVALVAVRPLV